MQVSRFDLTDVDEVASALDGFFPGVVVGSTVGEGLGFRLAAHSNGLGLNLVDIDIHGRDLSVRLEDMTGVMVTTATVFDGEMVDSGRAVDSTLPYATRTGLASGYSSAAVSSLSLDEEAMEAYLRRRVGGTIRGSFRFTGAAPKTPEHAVMWRSLASTAGTALRAGWAEDPLLGPSLTDTVAAACLTCFPSNWVDTDRAPRSRPTAAVRRARVFIEEHAHGPVTLNEIAAAARLSPRGLLAGFRSQLGVTPMAYVRRVRLEQARKSLRESDAGRGGRVEEIARAAGFTHMGRFAAVYRDAFGEYPGQTLRG